MDLSVQSSKIAECIRTQWLWKRLHKLVAKELEENRSKRLAIEEENRINKLRKKKLKELLL
jgi:hypothetical protein